MSRRKKIVIAAGGTGGHLFPAQALAEELKNEDVDILFMGAGLSSNRYFNRDKHSFYDVPSATIFGKKILKLFQSLFHLIKGINSSRKLLKKEDPDLIVGFGSFHSFPVLLAAKLNKKPLALFESNAYPGKVNRLFSSSAHYTAILFPQAQNHLKGKAIEVEMPLCKSPQPKSLQTVYGYFGLDPRFPTILIFGGSQGAASLNQAVVKAMKILTPHYSNFQVIHITGKQEIVDSIKEEYASLNIRACVKAFEMQMDIAYQAAAFAICRSGAATISELIAFAIPSILIPFPHAADDHQAKNALFMQTEVKGGICLPEKVLTKEILAMEIYRFLDSKVSDLEKMKKELHKYQRRQEKKRLSILILDTLKKEPRIN